jgi:hypothetical protein
MKNDKILSISSALGAVMIASVVPEVAWGTCTRSDVDYYLGQGFTREQVVTLCAGKPATRDMPASIRSAPESEKTKGESLPAVKTTGETKAPPSTPATPGEARPLADATGDDLEDFLKSAIEGYEVHLSDQALHYTRRTCIEYGPYNQFGIKTEACPDVRYAIARAGLRVKSVKQALLILGNLEVTVSGRIERKILDLDRYQPNLRDAIGAHLENGSETIIPIRDGVSEARLQAALRELPL